MSTTPSRGSVQSQRHSAADVEPFFNLEAASGFEPEYGALQHPYPCATLCLTVPVFRGSLGLVFPLRALGLSREQFSRSYGCSYGRKSESLCDCWIEITDCLKDGRRCS